MRMRTPGFTALIAVVGVGLGAAACAEDGTSAAPETRLLSVAPEGGSEDVDASSATIEVEFDHAMHAHAGDYMAVHEGDVTGPEVMGSWMMEENGASMRFVPDTGLRQGMQHTIHLGGGLKDADGHMVDLETHGSHMGGEWAEGSMMHGGMMGGGHPHMGDGWHHPDNGSYGMLFRFTTAP